MRETELFKPDDLFDMKDFGKVSEIVGLKSHYVGVHVGCDLVSW